MKQACAFEDNSEFQPVPATTRRAPELPSTIRVCRHNETARERARQLLRLQTGKDIALLCSRIHCARDDDECGFHYVPARNNGAES